MKYFFVLVYSIFMNCSFLSATILKPVKENDSEISLILISGAQIHPKQYISLAKEIQNKSKRKIWVNIYQSTLNFSNPISINSEIASAQSELEKLGAKSSRVFIAGHSLGGSMIQYLDLERHKIDGMVFLGSFIARNKRAYMKNLPSLTIAGELDGLTRSSRIAESYHLDIERQERPQQAKLHHPIYLIKGMNHSQFSSGRQPFLIRKRDLESEVSNDDAHQQVAEAVSDFLEFQVNPNAENSKQIIEKVSESGKTLKPFIDAMLLEGNYHLHPPCSEVASENCVPGSPWTSKMFVEFSGIDHMIENTDEFRKVWSIFPFFFPEIQNSCDPDDLECVLKTKTISQAVYEKLDFIDTAFAPVSAFEIRAKFISRQNILTALGEENVDFNESDGYDACQKLNQLALDWAIEASSSEAITRYYSKGIPMIVGPDLGPYRNGAKWIWLPLAMNLSNDSLEVRSPCIKTPRDFPIKKASGLHYCKLLSPARALEWINIDSLRTAQVDP